VSDAESVRSLATTVVEKYSSTNVVVHNAAICQREDLVAGGNAQVREQTVATNLLGPMRLTEALLPHLLKQPGAAVLTFKQGSAARLKRPTRMRCRCGSSSTRRWRS
jgi:uncharacterized oxidoreductase